MITIRLIEASSKIDRTFWIQVLGAGAVVVAAILAIRADNKRVRENDKKLKRHLYNTLLIARRKLDSLYVTAFSTPLKSANVKNIEDVPYSFEEITVLNHMFVFSNTEKIIGSIDENSLEFAGILSDDTNINLCEFIIFSQTVTTYIKDYNIVINDDDMTAVKYMAQLKPLWDSANKHLNQLIKDLQENQIKSGIFLKKKKQQAKEKSHKS